MDQAKADVNIQEPPKGAGADIVLFCGFSLYNAIPTRTDTFAGSLLVLTLSEIV